MLAESEMTLKPRGIGELFDQAIRLYRNNFLKFIGIIAVAQIPIQLLTLIVNVLTYGNTMDLLSGSASSGSPEALSQMMGRFGPGMLGSIILAILSYVLVQGFAVAALTRAITGSYFGEEIGIEDAYRKIGGAWKSLLGAFLLLFVLDIVFLIWSLIPCIGWFTGFGILYFITMVITLLIAPIVIIERRSGSQAIRRAWNLARNRFWWLLGYTFLLTLFSLLIIQGPVALMNGFFQSQIGSGLDSSRAYTYQLIAQSLVTLVLSLLYQPLQSACAIMAYFDLRVRMEGFDLAMMANQSGQQPLAAFEVASQAPSSSGSTSLVTWPEIGNFAILSLIFGLLYFFVILLVMGLGALMSAL